MTRRILWSLAAGGAPSSGTDSRDELAPQTGSAGDFKGKNQGEGGGAVSNFFEQELRKLFGDGKIIHDPAFVGRACVGGLRRGQAGAGRICDHGPRGPL